MCVFTAKKHNSYFLLLFPSISLTSDNIRIWGDYVWICTEGPGLYVRGKGVTEEKFGNAKAVLLAPATGQQVAGMDFSPDGTRFYLNFYGGGTWQFWRDDGQSFELVPGV